MIQIHFHAKVQVVRSKNGGEHFKQKLWSYFLEKGIVHQITCIDIPQQMKLPRGRRGTY